MSLRYAHVYIKEGGRRRIERNKQTEVEREIGLFVANKMIYWTRRILKYNM